MKIKSYLYSGCIALTVAMMPTLAWSAESSTSSDSSAASNAIIVLDASGSMWGTVRGETKIDVARRAIRQLVRELPKNTQLGLVAYGHRRKGDCADIELLIPLQKLDAEKFMGKVDSIMPKGMTPLTSAIEFAAESLAFKEQKATVILVSDGKETCHRDPCEVAKKLEELGVDFTAHVIAFDLSEKDAKSIECIAKNTGGQFLKANDAGTLTDALQMVLEKEDEKEEVKLDPATVKGPGSVPAGSEFKVEWTGPNNKGDYITIVPKNMEDGKYKNYTYTRNGSPVKLTALMDVGPAELRYMTAKAGKVLGRADIEITPVAATLKAVEKCAAGNTVKIEWTGPNNPRDYITIVPKALEDGKYLKYSYTKNGETLKVEAPMKTGECEIRYMSGQGDKVLGRRDLLVEEAGVTLKAIEKCAAGNTVKIEWTGPNNSRDYITIVPKALEDGKYLKYSYTKNGETLKVEAPMKTGECEIRYMSGQGDKVLARRKIMVEKAEVNLKANPEALVGAVVQIEWTGPNNARDYITIVPVGTPEGKYKGYTYTKKGSPMKVKAPAKEGACEVRYVAGQDGATLFSVPLMIKQIEPEAEDENETESE